ncbi:hypothetical protein BDZ90DRAFT_230770, partial [Jaminaea rosea]
MEALMGGMGSQANSAAIQAQKAEERQAEQLQPFYLENIVHNQRQIANIRSLSLALSGSLAGILGLVSLPGLAFFLFSLVTTNALILLLCCNGQPHKYLLNPPPQSPLGLVFSIGSSVATAAAIASPGIVAYGAAAVLGGAANTANSAGKVRVQKVVGGKEGKDVIEVVWYLFEGLKGEVLSFVLWWTFWTAIVH